MPRLACPEEPRVALHVVQRGRARSACFSCAGDRAAYLDALRECAARAGCAVHAYALMGNHVHLLFTAVPEAGAAPPLPAVPPPLSPPPPHAHPPHDPPRRHAPAT